jgi:hypothetical protein
MTVIGIEFTSVIPLGSLIAAAIISITIIWVNRIALERFDNFDLKLDSINRKLDK